MSIDVVKDKNLIRKKIACRAVIVDDGHVFVVKHSRTWIVCYPGGTLDPWETIHQCFAREIHEELGIHVVNPTLFLIHEYLWWEKDMLEFFFVIENNKDFRERDTHASHARELHHVEWLSLDDAEDNALPHGLTEKLQAFRETGQLQFLTEIV